MRDRLRTVVVPKFPSIKNIVVMDSNDIARQLENNRDVARTAYAHLVTPGDVIQQLLDNRRNEMESRALTLQMFINESYKEDQYAQLEQAGEVSDDRLHLRRVFIDLYASPASHSAIRHLRVDGVTKDRLRQSLNDVDDDDEFDEDSDQLSVLQLMLEEQFDRLVLIGGPGEGKST